MSVKGILPVPFHVFLVSLKCPYISNSVHGAQKTIENKFKAKLLLFGLHGNFSQCDTFVGYVMALSCIHIYYCQSICYLYAYYLPNFQVHHICNNFTQNYQFLLYLVSVCLKAIGQTEKGRKKKDIQQIALQILLIITSETNIHN